MYRVLLVDDEPIVCMGMRKLIDWSAFRFEIAGTASNGQEAYESHRENHYDLIITDLKMPLLDGLGLLRKLAEDRDPCPVIIVSAYGEFEYAREAMRYGVRYYLLKPVDEDVLSGYLCNIAETLQKRGPDFAPGDDDLPVRQQRLAQNGIVTEIRRYVAGHLGEELSLCGIAQVFNFNPVYLGRVFKRAEGQAFNEYLNRTRIARAKELLQNEDDMIYEVADRVGYRDLNYFNRCFKNIVGITPSEFRNGKTEREEGIDAT